MSAPQFRAPDDSWTNASDHVNCYNVQVNKVQGIHSLSAYTTAAESLFPALLHCVFKSIPYPPDKTEARNGGAFADRRGVQSGAGEDQRVRQVC